MAGSRPCDVVTSVGGFTLALTDVSPRTEVQLLNDRHPNPRPDPAPGNLTTWGSTMAASPSTTWKPRSFC
jgi:hypothetical protein